ncbi:MAG: hypothetical protein NVS9B10_20530 [Nevskia sp.]
MSTAEPAIVAEYDTGPITREMLAAYAAASGDSNPLHLDAAFAQNAGFDDVIVHGMLGMALLGRLLGERFPDAPLLAFEAHFAGIVPVGESLHCRARLREQTADARTLELEALDGRGRVVIAGAARLGL